MKKPEPDNFEQYLIGCALSGLCAANTGNNEITAKRAVALARLVRAELAKETTEPQIPLR